MLSSPLVRTPSSTLPLLSTLCVFHFPCCPTASSMVWMPDASDRSSRAGKQAGVAVPAELDVLSKPVLLSIGDKDAMMDMSQVEQAQKVFQTTLAEKRPGVKFEVKVYPNVRFNFFCLFF